MLKDLWQHSLLPLTTANFLFFLHANAVGGSSLSKQKFISRRAADPPHSVAQRLSHSSSAPVQRGVSPSTTLLCTYLRAQRLRLAPCVRNLFDWKRFAKVIKRTKVGLQVIYWHCKSFCKLLFGIGKERRGVQNARDGKMQRGRCFRTVCLPSHDL